MRRAEVTGWNAVGPTGTGSTNGRAKLRIGIGIPLREQAKLASQRPAASTAACPANRRCLILPTSPAIAEQEACHPGPPRAKRESKGETRSY